MLALDEVSEPSDGSRVPLGRFLGKVSDSEVTNVFLQTVRVFVAISSSDSRSHEAQHNSKGE